MTPLEQHFTFQQELFGAVLRMMLRGCRIDHGRRSALRKELLEAAVYRQDLLNFMAGHPLNPKSPKQLMRFFYEDLALPGIKHLTRGNLTTDSAPLGTIATRYPILLPLCQTIAELRSIGVFLSTFIESEPDIDGRMRSSFSIAGPTTYRFSSSENAFGSGMNLQNLPVGEKEKIKGAVRTDFILSAEIIVISLGAVAAAGMAQRVGVLVAISVLMTVGVYGLVAGIVKLDDLGL